MDTFRWLAVALSMLLGLGVTRLLTSAVLVFKARNHTKLDWIPFIWAFCIFLWQIQFWWGIIELSTMVHVWKLSHFITLLCLPLLLFLAAALIFPMSETYQKETFKESFEENGKWALVALSGYFILAVFVDWLFWNMSPVSFDGFLLMFLSILPLFFIFNSSRKIKVMITITYVFLSMIAMLDLSRSSY